MSQRLRLAIQSSGRLSDSTSDLLSACGIRVNKPDRKLRMVSDHFDLEVLFVRDDDIPNYVADGVADAGVVGENVVLEKNRPVRQLDRLGFAGCRLSIALPKADKYDSIQDLNGRHIATSYPGLLGRYLEKHGVDASIHMISGSVEIAPGIGLADGICDIVSSGSTLISNGLKEVEVILRSEAVLIASESLSEEKQDLLDRLRFRIQSVLTAKKHRYILMNVPNAAIDKVIDILPGMKAPTVMPLATEGWSSVHSVIPENAFWDVIESLKEAGAEGMLVVPIEKMVL
ncbi:MAG: ATP phosphoribosyltransferase [Bacteroidetes bacterium]|nr:ATP phosphoribosyltransferase [Bacteroidota bacterium]MDA1334280.1 ATP phosphoribosyltransferase [Bacteroidota bacterium]